VKAKVRCRASNRAAGCVAIDCRLPVRQYLVPLAVVLVACSLVSGVRSEPVAADFPALAEAYGPIDKFVSDVTVVVGKTGPAESRGQQARCNPIPAGSRVVAFEENGHFLFAASDASHVIRSGKDAQAKEGKPSFIRRVVFLKPSVFVIDDLVSRAPSDQPLRWQVHYRGKPTADGCRLLIAGADRQLACETLWPLKAVPKKTSGGQPESKPVYQIEVKPKKDAERCLQVFQILKKGDDAAAAKTVLDNKDGRFELSITAADRVFRLSLPPPGDNAGRISVAAAGKALVPLRPLPSGVLPHGPKGMALIDRWDSRYREGCWPPWERGSVAEGLKKAVEDGSIKPCRTVVLGCGLGTNAIYLARKGFDVTAIDVAPTAVGIAETKAKEAGVRVRFMLADVLALPDLEPFDFIFDRGCYHNVRYGNAAGFIESVAGLSRPGTRMLVLSLNRDGPPGVREKTMRDDFSPLFEFEWIRDSTIFTGKDGKRSHKAWSVMLRAKKEVEK